METQCRLPFVECQFCHFFKYHKPYNVTCRRVSEGKCDSLFPAPIEECEKHYRQFHQSDSRRTRKPGRQIKKPGTKQLIGGEPMIPLGVAPDSSHLLSIAGSASADGCEYSVPLSPPMATARHVFFIAQCGLPRTNGSGFCGRHTQGPGHSYPVTRKQTKHEKPRDAQDTLEFDPTVAWGDTDTPI